MTTNVFKHRKKQFFCPEGWSPNALAVNVKREAASLHHFKDLVESGEVLRAARDGQQRKILLPLLHLGATGSS